MEIQGKIMAIMPVQSGVSKSGNNWMSQEYVIDYFWWPNQTQATQMMFKVMGEDRIRQFDLQIGDEVKIDYHIAARPYNNRWFNEVICTRATKIGASAQPEGNQVQSQEPNVQNNGLPFQ